MARKLALFDVDVIERVTNPVSEGSNREAWRKDDCLKFTDLESLSSKSVFSFKTTDGIDLMYHIASVSRSLGFETLRSDGSNIVI